MKDIRVASVQFEHAPSDKQANLTQIAHWAEKATSAGAQILATLECCITGYWHLRHLSRADLEALAEPVPGGPSSQALMDLARQHQMTIGAGLVEIAGDECGNSIPWRKPVGLPMRNWTCFTMTQVPHGAGFL